MCKALEDKRLLKVLSTEEKGHYDFIKISFIHIPSPDKEHEG